jgi:hypothetical protein
MPVAAPVSGVEVKLWPYSEVSDAASGVCRKAGSAVVVAVLRYEALGAQAPLSILYSGAKTARNSSSVSKVSSSPSSFPSLVTAGGSTWVRARASSRPKTDLGSSSSSALP